MASVRLLTIIIFAILTTLIRQSLSELDPPVDVYNICVLISFVGHSHRAFIFTLVEALLERGHRVTVLSGLPPVLNHTNATEITHTVPIPTTETRNKFKEKQNKEIFSFFESHLSALARDLYNDPQVKELYKRRDDFDLFITDASFNEQTYPFLHQKLFILAAPIGKLNTVFASQGNPLNPSYAPVFNHYPRPWSIFSRIWCLYDNINFYNVWRRGVVRSIQKEIRLHFPELPPIVDIEKNSSLVLLNSHHVLDYAGPLLPSQVELGCIQCRDPLPLPHKTSFMKHLLDVLDWIEGSGSHGVVYFSIGSITRGNSMPSNIKEIFIKAFARLKQRVLWKFEEDISNLPDNVMIKKWMPQQDIIAHPKVRVFMSHCGLLGYQEAVYHATPILAVPIQGDQIKYSDFIIEKGFGVKLLWEELTVERLVEYIEELVHNTKYKDNISRASIVLRDQPMPSKETAVWWTEYVIRHKGAPKLRSPAADLSWTEFLMIDVIVLLYVLIFATMWFIKICLNYVMQYLTKEKLKKQ